MQTSPATRCCRYWRDPALTSMLVTNCRRTCRSQLRLGFFLDPQANVVKQTLLLRRLSAGHEDVCLTSQSSSMFSRASVRHDNMPEGCQACPYHRCFDKKIHQLIGGLRHAAMDRIVGGACGCICSKRAKLWQSSCHLHTTNCALK